jgi:hypothetical protein
MQVVNITQKINEAANLIEVLKPVLKVFGNFEYQILMKGKESPQIILQMYFIGVNTWTKVVLNCISNLATNKEYYFTLETIDEQTKIALNIHI